MALEKKSRYRFKYQDNRLHCLDTHQMVEPNYWERVKEDLTPRRIIALNITLLPHCCAYTELGGFQYYKHYLDGDEVSEIPPPDAIEAMCDAVMARLKREHTTIAIASFLKLTKDAPFNGQELMDCLISKHRWTKVGGEFTNNRYRSPHILQTIQFQFPPRRKRNNV